MVKFELITLDGTKFSEDVHEVRLPTVDGEIGVFTNHAPLVSVAATGVIIVRKQPGDPEQKWVYFASNGGVIEVLDNRVRVLVDEADRDDEINEQEVQKALERARTMRNESVDQMSLDKAQSLMDRESTRIKVAEIKRRHRGR